LSVKIDTNHTVASIKKIPNLKIDPEISNESQLQRLLRFKQAMEGTPTNIDQQRSTQREEEKEQEDEQEEEEDYDEDDENDDDDDDDDDEVEYYEDDEEFDEEEDYSTEDEVEIKTENKPIKEILKNRIIDTVFKDIEKDTETIKQKSGMINKVITPIDHHQHGLSSYQSLIKPINTDTILSTKTSNFIHSLNRETENDEATLSRQQQQQQRKKKLIIQEARSTSIFSCSKCKKVAPIFHRTYLDGKIFHEYCLKCDHCSADADFYKNNNKADAISFYCGSHAPHSSSFDEESNVI
jgi:hypothetical protein